MMRGFYWVMCSKEMELREMGTGAKGFIVRISGFSYMLYFFVVIKVHFLYS